MARRIQIKLVVLLLFYSCSFATALDPSSILVSYSFDDGNVETGPDTFAVFQHSKGTVRLNNAYRFSGYQSVEIRDVADDGDFPELQGYFNLRKAGKVFAHFTMMTADPLETLNVALAGPKWFTLHKDGIGFWLKTRKGFLYHVSDSMPKKLFALQAFTWYIFDVAYDIDGGVYNLVIRQEGISQPIVSLENQINAIAAKGSEVDKFSFIGDEGEDTSNVVYFLDDVVIGTDRSITQLPFVAPGRRKLFLDYWMDYRRKSQEQPVCVAATSLLDFGITEGAVAQMKAAGLLDSLNLVLAGQPVQNLQASPFLQAIHLWKEGCDALTEQKFRESQKKFETAAQLIPEGRIYKLSAAMASGSLAEIFSLQKDWRDDPRFDLASAMIALRSGDLATAEQILQKTATSPDSAGASAYFSMLLLQNRNTEAQQFALRMADQLDKKKENSAYWMECAGDAAFLLKDLSAALRYYEDSLLRHKECNCTPPSSNYLKLADVYFLLGDLNKERAYRESIYGSLFMKN